MSIVNDFVEEVKSRILADSTFDKAVIPTRSGKDPDGDHAEEPFFLMEDKSVIIRALDVEPFPDYDRVGNPPGVGQMLPVMVTIMTIPSEKTDIESFVKQGAANGSSAQTAISSVSNWYRMGGNAIDSRMGPLKFSEPSDENPGSVYFIVSILYRVSETNFETIRA